MANAKKILFINTLCVPHIGGGAEIILQIQAKALQDRGFDVAVLATGPERGIKSEIVDGVKVYRVGLSNIYWPYAKKDANAILRLAWHLFDRYNRRMRRHAKNVMELEKPDFVFCHNLLGWSISVWDAFKSVKIPFIQVLHDQYLLCPKTTMFKNDKVCETQCVDCKLLRLRHKSASKNVTAVVGVSAFILNKFEIAGYFKNSVKVTIHNAIVLDQQQRLKVEKRPTFQFGFIGKLGEFKGIEWLIEQFKSLDINATLIIAGKGKPDYEEHLKKIANDTRIIFLGYVKPEDFYSKIDVCVVPSKWQDTFPGVAIESCAYGKPVIASNSGGLPEIIKNNKNGLICDIADPSSLGRSMKQIFEDEPLLNDMKINARKAVTKLLDVDRMINEYISLMNQLSETTTHY